VKQLPLTAAVQLPADIGLRGRQLLFSPFRSPLGRESPSPWSAGRIDSTFLAATKIAAVMFLPVRLETKGRRRGHSERNIFAISLAAVFPLAGTKRLGHPCPL